MAVFSDRVRFNWGFHHATLSVVEGWMVPERNFGLGDSLTIREPADVRRVHPDAAWALGWEFGHRIASEAGKRPDSSEPAWREAVGAGLVADGE